MKIRRLFLIFALLIILLLSSCGIEGTVDPYKTKAPDTTFKNGMDVGEDKKYDELIFKKDTVLEIAINIDPSYLEQMRSTPDSQEYYSANVKVGDIEIKNAGLRITGNAELDGGETSQNRFSYKIKFDKFVDKQKLEGLDEMVLSNASRDPSYMREYLTCEAFAKIGLPAPLSVYANVNINGIASGLYICLESIDDSFLKRVFDNNDGNLYKSGSNTNLADLNSLSLLEQKNGKDDTKADLESLLNSLSSIADGQKGNIEEVLDVDSVLKYIAVNTLLGNYDSYIGSSCDNFYLARNGSKFSIIPWDFNLSFGAQKKDNGASVSVSVDTPVYRCDMAQRPLVEKILSVSEYKTKYMEYIGTMKDFLNGLNDRVNTIDSIISTFVNNDPTAFYTHENYLHNIGKSESGETGIISITEYARLRLENIN